MHYKSTKETLLSNDDFSVISALIIILINMDKDSEWVVISTYLVGCSCTCYTT